MTSLNFTFGKINLDINGADNVEFRLGKVENVLPQLLENGIKPQIVVLDPPRKGCAPSTLETVLKLAPEMILYVSCNPVTLARDLKILRGRPRVGEQGTLSDRADKEFGYKTEQVVPIDLFPQTYHVESVAVLHRQSNGQTINVEEAGEREGSPSF